MPTYTFPTNIAVGDLGQVTWANSISSALNALGPLVDTKANDADVVKLTGNQTVAGTKTFSAAPSVPDSSFSIAKTSGLQSALDGKVPATRTVAGKALSADVTLAKADVGLGSVDNTSDASKPVSTATQTALNAKAPLASPTFTGDPKAPTPVTSDNDTSIATTAFVKAQGYATTSALADKLATVDAPELIRDTMGTALVAGANVTITPDDVGETITISASGGGGGGAVDSVNGRTGAVTLTKSDVGLSSVDNTSDASKPVSTATQTALDGKVPTTRTVAGKALSANVTLVKGDVGLGNVDNTSDASKPVSTATQNALNAKAPLASPTFTGTVSGISKSMVGLGNVDNTSDASKPVSTATQTALNGKVGLGGAALTTGGTFWGVFEEGSEPTPPSDGKIHWGFRVPA